MSGTTSAGGSGSSAATHERLEREVAQLRARRAELAGELRGEDVADRDFGDRGDQADRLERGDDLARMDRRITELMHLIAEVDEGRIGASPVDGTVVTLRFPDGDVSRFRIVTIAEQAPDDEAVEVLTADSPRGRALVGCRPGDTVSYQAPSGRVQAEVLDVAGS